METKFTELPSYILIKMKIEKLMEIRKRKERKGKGVLWNSGGVFMIWRPLLYGPVYWSNYKERYTNVVVGWP